MSKESSAVIWSISIYRVSSSQAERFLLLNIYFHCPSLEVFAIGYKLKAHLTPKSEYGLLKAAPFVVLRY